jgi:hypothetical protein
VVEALRSFGQVKNRESDASRLKIRPNSPCDMRIMPGFETSRGIGGQLFDQNSFESRGLFQATDVDPAFGRFTIASQQGVLDRPFGCGVEV